MLRTIRRVRAHEVLEPELSEFADRHWFHDQPLGRTQIVADDSGPSLRTSVTATTFASLPTKAVFRVCPQVSSSIEKIQVPKSWLQEFGFVDRSHIERRGHLGRRECRLSH